MIKIMSIIGNKIWRIVLLLIIILSFCLIVLFNGFTINSLHFDNLSIEKLYIRLDKKFIVKIQKVEVDSPSSNTTSLQEISAFFDYAHLMSIFFKKIAIENLIFDDKEVRISYQNNIYSLKTNNLIFETELIDVSSRPVIANINRLELIDFNVSINGKLLVDIEKNKFHLQGNFNHLNIDGLLDVEYKNDKFVKYKISTNDFDSLAPFMDSLIQKININKEISDWIYKKITANNYKLDYLEGKFDTITRNFFPYEMKAKAHAKNVFIRFNENVDKVFVKKLEVTLEENTLKFLFDEALYNNVIVTSPDLYIYNLLTENQGIVVHLQTDTLYDKKINSILEAYDIELSLNQKTGKTKADLRLDIRFNPLEIKVNGNFLAENANLTFHDVDFFSRKTHVLLNNNNVSIINSHVKYKDIADIDIKHLNIDLNEKKINSKLLINKVFIEDFVDMNQTILSMDGDFKNNSFNLNFPDLDISLSSAESISLKFGNLSLINEYLPILQRFQIHDGKIDANIKNKDSFSANASIKTSRPVFSREDQMLFEMNLFLNKEKNGILIRDKDNLIQIRINDATKITLENTKIVIYKDDENPSRKDIVDLIGKNSGIFLPDFNESIQLDSMKAIITGDAIFFQGDARDAKIEFFKSNNRIEISANNVDDIFINSFTSSPIVDGGIYNININGVSFNDFNGTFTQTGGIYRGLAVYHNIIELINTVPGLLSFRGPDFNEEGLSVRNARIDFVYKKPNLKLEEILFNGRSANITGVGVWNTNTDEINMELFLATLAPISNAINIIPGVNYIILGEDRRMGTNVSVTGTLNKPNVSTNILEDALMAPVNIILRTILLPFQAFN